MYLYTVREPFAGFAKGETLSQAQIDAYEAKGGHADHHAIRVWRPDPLVPAAAKLEVERDDTVPAKLT